MDSFRVGITALPAAGPGLAVDLPAEHKLSIPIVPATGKILSKSSQHFLQHFLNCHV
jgi:hypothetical protein